MTRPLERDALRIIQDVVREATGKGLPAEARQRLERLLRAIGKGTRPEPGAQAFSSREVTILFADVRGFSALVSDYSTEVVLRVLDRCFARMTEIIVRHYGTIHKFIGDAIMVIFPGDPTAPRNYFAGAWSRIRLSRCWRMWAASAAVLASAMARSNATWASRWRPSSRLRAPVSPWKWK